MADPLAGQVTGSTTEVDEERFVPALLLEWAPRVADAAQLAPGQRALDVACGTGVPAREMARRVQPGGAVTGLDRNGGTLPLACKHGNRGQALNTARHSKDGRKPTLQDDGVRNRRDLIGAIREVFRIMARAQAAAHVYADLRHRCDADLAKKGLRRSDLPRAAYDALTRES